MTTAAAPVTTKLESSQLVIGFQCSRIKWSVCIMVIIMDIKLSRLHSAYLRNHIAHFLFLSFQNVELK